VAGDDIQHLECLDLVKELRAAVADARRQLARPIDLFLRGRRQVERDDPASRPQGRFVQGGEPRIGLEDLAGQDRAYAGRLGGSLLRRFWFRR